MNLPSAQVETLLKDQDPPKSTAQAPTSFQGQTQNTYQDGFGPSNTLPMADSMPQMYSTSGASPQDPIIPDSLNMGLDEDFSWEMIGLGLDEPLPQQDIIDELFD